MNHHAALIDPANFAKVQKLIAERAPDRAHPREVGSRHALSGLIFCSHCGSKMIAGVAKSGRFIYYSCQRKFKEGRASCVQKSLNARKLEPCIIGVTKDRLLTEEHLSKLIRMVFEELEHTETDKSEKVTALKAQLEDTEKKLQKYFGLIESESVLIQDVAPRLRELNAVKETTLAELTKLEKTVALPKTVMPTAEVVRGFVEDLGQNLARRKHHATEGIFALVHQADRRPGQSGGD